MHGPALSRHDQNPGRQLDASAQVLHSSAGGRACLCGKASQAVLNLGQHLCRPLRLRHLSRRRHRHVFLIPVCHGGHDGRCRGGRIHGDSALALAYLKSAACPGELGVHRLYCQGRGLFRHKAADSSFVHTERQLIIHAADLQIFDCLIAGDQAPALSKGHRFHNDFRQSLCLQSQLGYRNLQRRHSVGALQSQGQNLAAKAVHIREHCLQCLLSSHPADIHSIDPYAIRDHRVRVQTVRFHCLTQSFSRILVCRSGSFLCSRCRPVLTLRRRLFRRNCRLLRPSAFLCGECDPRHQRTGREYKRQQKRAFFFHISVPFLQNIHTDSSTCPL